MPIVWALRRMGFESAERVTGADLLPGISQRCAKSGQTIFLCGGMEGWADTAARNLQSQFPGLKVAGTIFPPFGFEKNEKASGQMIEAINRVSPDFLFVGVGCPKQELWIQNYRHRLNCGVIMGVGMAIAFSANATKRAPKWMHDIGAEWFFRMMTEPRRLGPRYMKDLQVFPLLARAIKEAKESRSPTSEGGK